MATSPHALPGPDESAELRMSSELVGVDAWQPGRGSPHPAGSYGFFTDTTVCIGCKACEVACKQWNQLPDDGFVFTGDSYDNTGDLGASTWRHVAFAEREGPVDLSWFGEDFAAVPGVGVGASPAEAGGSTSPAGAAAEDPFRWLMMSDVCKHCTDAGCLDVCPTGSIIRTEYDSVFVQPDICNGCGMCVVACPFGVIDRRGDDGRAFKCTLCYDRLHGGLEPACAKACPTDSIVFGEVDDLVELAQERVAVLHERGVSSAYLYGADPDQLPGTGRLNAFFLLTDRPEVYNLPPDPVDPTHWVGSSWRSALTTGAAMLAAVVGAVVTVAAGRSRR